MSRKEEIYIDSINEQNENMTVSQYLDFEDNKVDSLNLESIKLSFVGKFYACDTAHGRKYFTITDIIVKPNTRNIFYYVDMYEVDNSGDMVKHLNHLRFSDYLPSNREKLSPQMYNEITEKFQKQLNRAKKNFDEIKKILNKEKVTSFLNDSPYFRPIDKFSVKDYLHSNLTLKEIKTLLEKTNQDNFVKLANSFNKKILVYEDESNGEYIISIFDSCNTIIRTADIISFKFVWNDDEESFSILRQFNTDLNANFHISYSYLIDENLLKDKLIAMIKNFNESSYENLKERNNFFFHSLTE